MTPIFEYNNVLLTGGCGFIGSHFVEELQKYDIEKIQVIDNLSSGDNSEFIQKFNNVHLLELDIKEINQETIFEDDYDIIIHLAAQPSVPISVKRPFYDFKENVVGSMKLLEFARKNDIKEFVFAASGGTVYGEAEKLPTPEFYPLRPISNYGASKAAFEMYLSSYAELYGMKTTSLRFGNVYGSRSRHGVMFDFFQKLKENPDELEILGNGEQEKSYLYIDDCVSGFISAMDRPNSGFEMYNMAGKESISVNEIADIMCQELSISPKYSYTGGERGWKGDVRKGELDTTKLQSLGWNPQTPFKYGLYKYIQWLKETYGW